MAVLPISTVTRPAVLAGKSNGLLPGSILDDTLGQAGGPTVRLVSPAARAWRALTAAALAAGHTLKASGPSDSYRPYSVQEKIFLQRYTTTPNGTSPRSWQGKLWYKKPGVAAAAVPGTSNHGYGLAVDVGVELDGDAGTESIDPAAVAWLVANEQRFGFSHELQSEPWHIRYFAGDVIPAAVLEHERQTTPTRKAYRKMLFLIHAKGDTAVWLTDFITRRHVVDPADLARLQYVNGLLGGTWIFNNGQPVEFEAASVNAIPIAGVGGSAPADVKGAVLAALREGTG